MVALMAWRVVDPIEDNPSNVDAIVVLSGEHLRVQRGLELFKNGWAPLLVVSEGESWDDVSARCGLGEMFSVWCPVPEEDSTRGEARMISHLATEQGWSSFMVVTSGYHAARARMLINRCLDDSVKVFWVLAESARPSTGLIRSEVSKRLYATVFERSC